MFIHLSFLEKLESLLQLLKCNNLINIMEQEIRVHLNFILVFPFNFEIPLIPFTSFA